MTTSRVVHSPLDRAKSYEVIWAQVSDLFAMARPIANASFVYFIGEADGPLKIGVAQDPILRLRGMQTGNPRPLCVEHVLLGDMAIEKLLHELWEPFLITGEWFRAEIREELEPILETAKDLQTLKLLEVEPHPALDDMEDAVRAAHKEHDFVAKGRDSVRHLARGAGYVIERPSRI